MDWEAFAQGLVDALADLPAGGLLVIGEPEKPEQPQYGRYTQFAQSTDALDAYVVVNSFLEEPARASEEGERVIAAAGWHPPEPNAGHENWWTRLLWPATAEQYRAVTGMVVTALRDGYGIPDPGVLRYKAWNENTGDGIELPLLGLAAE